jgi:hypothetical protein
MTEQTPAELAASIAITKWGAELTAALSQTLNGVFLRGSKPVPVSTHPVAPGVPATLYGTQQISGSAGRLTGWTFRVPASAPGAAHVDLYDGRDNTGQLISSVTVLAGASNDYQHHGIGFVYGLYADITGAGADSLFGAVYLGATE